MRLQNKIGLIALFFCLVSGYAVAHDIYTDWKQPGTGISCCGGEDCHPTRAWQDLDGGWHSKEYMDGQSPIPTTVILPKQPDGRCHICLHNGYLMCFAPCDIRS